MKIALAIFCLFCFWLSLFFGAVGNTVFSVLFLASLVLCSITLSNDKKHRKQATYKK